MNKQHLFAPYARGRVALLVFILALACPLHLLGETRALLIACRSFVSADELGYEVSGNLQTLASALLFAGIPGERLFVEDGTIASGQDLQTACTRAFSSAAPDDLCLLYLCTHGVLCKTPSLLLSDGQRESRLSPEALMDILRALPGQKLLLLDACHGGAFLPEAPEAGLHVLTSSAASESAWYYAGQYVPEGSLSYFARALCAGLGLYGSIEADRNGDGMVSLSELHQHVQKSSPSSTAQLCSEDAAAVHLPMIAQSPLTQPLTAFSYSLPRLGNPDFRFSYTVCRSAQVHYRIVRHTPDGWDWAGALVLSEDPAVPPVGRLRRRITLPPSEDKLLFQVFALEGGLISLCSEHLIVPEVRSLPPSPSHDTMIPDPIPTANERNRT